MKRSGLAAVGLAVLAAAAAYGLWLSRGPTAVPENTESPAVVSSPLPAITAEPEAAVVSSRPAKSATPPRANVEGAKVQDSNVQGVATPPTVDQLREEAMRDPEAPSGAMLRYSVALEERTEEALESERLASPLFQEMDGCATNSGSTVIADSARVLCLSTASRLAEKYPAMKSKYENLESRTDARILKLKKLMDIR